MFHIANNGIKRFWRASASDLGGTGLGLVIVQRIGEAHGATLAITDRESGGAEFLIAVTMDAKG